jgi:hypothetical protein
MELASCSCSLVQVLHARFIFYKNELKNERNEGNEDGKTVK